MTSPRSEATVTEPVESRLTVLESFTGIHPTTNPYITQLAASLRSHPRIDVVLFSWRRALLGRYDVFHVHWPEQLMGGHRPAGRMLRRLLTTLLCLRLWLTRTPLVRTWHNVERPSGLAPVDRLLLRALDRLTTLRIRLNPVSEMPPDAPYATILLGDYRDWYARFPRQQPTPGRIAYVGLVRHYKGVEDLIDAFAQVEDDRLSLLVAGKPTSAELAARVRELAAADSRVDSRLEYLSEQEFVGAVTSAELIVLPYRFMHNSSAVLAALSLDRPVLVPDNEVNRLLAAEVGAGWIYSYAGSLDGEALASAAAAVHLETRERRPDLSQRTWDQVADDHEEAFRRAIRVKRDSRSLRNRVRALL